ncbi:uncharacterized protein EAE97_006888 [Botrytis byssoidea]|uniref:Uncharacterized protein n=1 Tax=Botrytis byssoidea TaxID=139641 RepID=A0A9P5LTS3_9HELO|nr:uncharacterized protein EAE97_006888 [Botrytis byssoidea]KAF7940702.1 hypothetical protein EAE97_006888 [Botrytis byssoidea]
MSIKVWLLSEDLLGFDLKGITQKLLICGPKTERIIQLVSLNSTFEYQNKWRYFWRGPYHAEANGPPGTRYQRDWYLRSRNLLTPVISEAYGINAMQKRSVNNCLGILDGSQLCAIENLNQSVYPSALRVDLMTWIIL